MNKRGLSILWVLPFVILLVLPIFSQGGPPDPPDPGVPIDGGLGFLLAAGLIYGVNRYKKSRKS